MMRLPENARNLIWTDAEGENRMGNNVNAPKPKKRKKIGSYVPYYVLLAPFLIAFITLTVLPILGSIFLSFTDFNMVQMPKWNGIGNYLRLFFQDDIFKIDIKNTLLIAIVTGPTGYILSFVIAWFINEFGRKMRTFLTFIMYAPALCGNAFFLWTFIFSADSGGLLNTLLSNLGLINDPIAWLSDTNYNMMVVMIVTIWNSFGVGFLSFRAGLQSLDSTYYEAAAIDGLRNRWQELYYVTFPQMGPQLLFGAVNAIAGAFGVGAINKALTGYPSTNYSTDTIVLHMQDHGNIRFEMGYASTIAVVLFVMMVVTNYIVKKALKRFTA